jgi:uncharacterized membrane protein YhhN
VLNLTILFVAGVLLLSLLYFEKQGHPKGILVTKTVLSSLFVLLALVQPHMTPGYVRFLLLGLLLCLGGDVFLALPGEKAFRWGLLFFLLGHAFYILAFFQVARINQWTWVGGLTGLLISVAVYLWLQPHLGPMRIHVMVYILVITVMFCGAWSVMGQPDLRVVGRVLVLAGALFFYFSDVFVARDRFVKEAFVNRLIGLPMYYAGQFLLAFSAGAVASSL